MSKNEKLTSEEKMRLIRRCISGEISEKEGSRVFGVARETVRKWIARYEAEGIGDILQHKKNRVYRAEQKIQSVQDYLSGKGSMLEICKRHRIRDTKTLRQWIKVYNAHGDFNSVKFSGGGSYMRQGRDTTHEERIRIAKECLLTGKNYGEIALKYNVSYQQVRSWTLRYEELGESGLEDRRGRRKKDQTPRTKLEEAQIEIERLKHELHKAEMERDLLKKLDEVMRRDAYLK